MTETGPPEDRAWENYKADSKLIQTLAEYTPSKESSLRLLYELIGVLPDPGEPLSARRREDWLRTANAVLEFLYPPPARAHRRKQ